MVTIDTNSGRRSNFDYPSLPEMINHSKDNKIGLNNLSNWHLFEKKILMAFPIFRKYENILRTGLYSYDVSKNHYYRPEYVSHELYGTTDLWSLLLFVNDMKSVDDFNRKNILVFPDNIIDTLNTIANDEKDNFSSVDLPRYTRKEYIKKLNEKSVSVLRESDDDKAAWNDTQSIDGKLPSLLAQDFYKSKFTINKGILKDENNGDVLAISLDSSGLTSVPSLYYASGFSRKLFGRIRLDSNKIYSLNSLYNGQVSLKVTNDAGDTIIEKLNKKFSFKEPMIIADNRTADRDIFNTYSVDSDIDFDQETGRYVMDTSINSTGVADKVLSKMKLVNSTDDRLDVTRLNGSDVLLFNIGYSTNLITDSLINKIYYRITVNYTNSTSKSSIVMTNRKEIFNTHGEISFLKHSLTVNKSLQISSVDIETVLDTVNGNVGLIELDHKLLSVHISSLSDAEVIDTFSVESSAWYNLEMSYEYRLRDYDNSEIYPSESMKGIYFNPSITEVINGTDIDFAKIADITDNGTQLNMEKVNVANPIQVKDGSIYDPKSFIKYFTKNLELPDRYIMTVKLSHKTISTGGGVGFIFDYDNSNESGYMLWISSTGSNPDLSEFSRDSGYAVMKTGFYELDMQYGTPISIFNGDTTNVIYVTNFYPLVLESKKIRVVKRYNRIRLYSTTLNGTFNMSTPILDIEDITNIHRNKGIGMYACFAGNESSLVDYFNWNHSDINVDAEW